MKIIRVKTTKKSDALSKEEYNKKYEEFGKVFGSPRFLGGCTGWGGDFAEFEYSDIGATVSMEKDGSIEVEWFDSNGNEMKKKFPPNITCRQVANFLKKEEAKI